MKKVSVSVFKKLLEEKGFREFRLTSEDQSWNNIGLPSQFELVFGEAAVACNPDIICLKGVCGLVYFRHIEYVYVAPVKTVLGTVFDVVCTDWARGDAITSYRILAVE